jgi:2-polyprenyl-6-methoxyphenol hydroxylase-like FAD-dependent oxidoreductase
MIYKREVAPRMMSDGAVTDRLNVVISGGSMGGLFTGLALRDDGHIVDVFEQSAGELESRGAGIVAQPRMLDFLDSHDIVRPDTITTTTARRQYLDQNGAVERGYAETMTFTSWDAVYRRLRDAFPDEHYCTGRTITGIDWNGGPVVMHLEDGDVMEGDLAVVAEGGQSSTRMELLPTVAPEYAGYVAWRGVTPEDAIPGAVHQQFEDTFTFYQGADDLILGYFIPGPEGETTGGKRRLNWVWYDNLRDRDERQRLMTDADGSQHEFSVPPGRLRSDVEDELLAAATDRLPSVFTDLVTATDDPFVQTIYDLTVPEMVFGRVCLLGDAAFVARPHTAAGTAKAAADGIELAEALGEHDDMGKALQHWEQARLDAGRQLVTEGQQMGNDYMT